jgi:5'-nucleotidase
MRHSIRSRTNPALIAATAAIALLLALAGGPALATGGGGGSGGPLKIVLTNDDGFETANIQALYDALVAAGHDVIMSAPYPGQGN